MNESKRELFERAPIWKSVAKLAVPTVISQIILVIYNIADTFFIGLTGSDEMIAAVTVCMPAFMFLSAIANLFGIGGSSVISRRLGQQETELARNTAAFSFWGCLGLTLLYSAFSLIFLDGFVDILGGSDIIVHKNATSYLLCTVVAGGVFTSMNALLGHLVRSEGRAVHASVGIALGGLLNIALDPLFMFVLLPRGNEVLGAALATSLSNIAGTAYFVGVLIRKRKRTVLSFRLRREAFRSGIPMAVLSTGLPACLMTLLENISYAVLDNLIAAYGTAMQAGLGVAKKVNMLAHSIVRGMAQGVLPLIAYNFGAGNGRRMRKALKTSAFTSVTLAVICMSVSLFAAHSLVEVFLQSGSDSLNFGARFLRILCIGAPFSACAYTFISFFQAVDEGKKSFFLAILRKGLLDIPLMLLLSREGQAAWIVWATPLVDMVCCFVSLALYLRFRCNVFTACSRAVAGNLSAQPAHK